MYTHIQWQSSLQKDILNEGASFIFVPQTFFFSVFSDFPTLKIKISKMFAEQLGLFDHALTKLVN